MDGADSTFSEYGHVAYQRATCIKGIIWTPLEPKTENCFSPISPYLFIRRKPLCIFSGIYCILQPSFTLQR